LSCIGVEKCNNPDVIIIITIKKKKKRLSVWSFTVPSIELTVANHPSKLKY
jgi:hypothetical protein